MSNAESNSEYWMKIIIHVILIIDVDCWDARRPTSRNDWLCILPVRCTCTYFYFVACTWYGKIRMEYVLPDIQFLKSRFHLLATPHEFWRELCQENISKQIHLALYGQCLLLHPQSGRGRRMSSLKGAKILDNCVASITTTN